MFIYGKETPWEIAPKIQPGPYDFSRFDRLNELNPLFLYEQEIPLEGFE